MLIGSAKSDFCVLSDQMYGIIKDIYSFGHPCCLITRGAWSALIGNHQDLKVESQTTSYEVNR